MEELHTTPLDFDLPTESTVCSSTTGHLLLSLFNLHWQSSPSSLNPLNDTIYQELKKRKLGKNNFGGVSCFNFPFESLKSLTSLQLLILCWELHDDSIANSLETEAEDEFYRRREMSILPKITPASRLPTPAPSERATSVAPSTFTNRPTAMSIYEPNIEQKPIVVTINVELERSIESISEEKLELAVVPSTSEIEVVESKQLLGEIRSLKEENPENGLLRPALKRSRSRSLSEQVVVDQTRVRKKVSFDQHFPPSPASRFSSTQGRSYDDYPQVEPSSWKGKSRELQEGTKLVDPSLISKFFQLHVTNIPFQSNLKMVQDFFHFGTYVNVVGLVYESSKHNGAAVHLLYDSERARESSKYALSQQCFPPFTGRIRLGVGKYYKWNTKHLSVSVEKLQNIFDMRGKIPRRRVLPFTPEPSPFPLSRSISKPSSKPVVFSQALMNFMKSRQSSGKSGWIQKPLEREELEEGEMW